MATFHPPKLETLQIIIDLHPTGELIVRTPVGFSMEDAIQILEAGIVILSKRSEVTIH